MNDLEENPLTLIDHNSKTPAILSKSLARQVVFAILYTPQTGFQSLAFILDLLYRGFGDALAPAFRMPGLSPFCGAGLPPYVFPDEAQIAIMCSDKRSPASLLHNARHIDLISLTSHVVERNYPSPRSPVSRNGPNILLRRRLAWHRRVRL